MSGESAAERWFPTQRVESVLLSIISLLDDPECSSPANVDAGVMLRKEPEKYREKVSEAVEASKKDIPEGFVMPTHESTSAPKMDKDREVDESFWCESDEEEFGGSDTDVGLEGEEDEEDDDDDDDGIPDRMSDDGDDAQDEDMPDTELDDEEDETDSHLSPNR